MSIKKSAKKALRQTEKRTKVNKDRKSNIKDLEKKLVKEISAKNKKEAAQALSNFSQALDKAVKNHVLLKNTASRQKSRFQKAINKLS